MAQFSFEIMSYEGFVLYILTLSTTHNIYRRKTMLGSARQDDNLMSMAFEGGGPAHATGQAQVRCRAGWMSMLGRVFVMRG